MAGIGGMGAPGMGGTPGMGPSGVPPQLAQLLMQILPQLLGQGGMPGGGAPGGMAAGPPPTQSAPVPPGLAAGGQGAPGLAQLLGNPQIAELLRTALAGQGAPGAGAHPAAKRRSVGPATPQAKPNATPKGATGASTTQAGIDPQQIAMLIQLLTQGVPGAPNAGGYASPGLMAAANPQLQQMMGAR